MSAQETQQILVAEDDPTTAHAVRRVLEKAGYSVVAVGDGRAALRELEKQNFFAVLVDWMMPELDGIEVLRRLSTRQGAKPRMLLTTSIDTPAARDHVRAVGGQDYLVKPVHPTRLLEALRTPKEEKSGTAPSISGQAHPLTRTHCWGELGTLSAKPMGEMLGAMLTPETIKQVADEGVAITCAMVDAVHNLEVVAAVSAVATQAKSIAALILGEEPESLSDAEDVLAELLNVVVGAVKTALVNDGFKFTLTLPTKVQPSDLVRINATALSTSVTRMVVGDMHFITSYAVRPSGAVEVRAEELREGMVLAADVKNATGGILMAACLRLTATTAKRMREICAGKRVWVHSLAA